MDGDDRLGPARTRFDDLGWLRDCARRNLALDADAGRAGSILDWRPLPLRDWVLGIAASFWSHLRGNPVWVTICVALPGFLVGWADLVSPYSFLRFLAAVVAFPLALSGAADVLWARGRLQRG